MKKSTLGMALLVAMVVTKALLPDMKATADDFIVRQESSSDHVQEFRTEHQSNFLFQPQFELLVSNVQKPSIKYLKEEKAESFNEDNYFSNEIAEVATETINTPSENDEVIPMEYVSNTGYGLWRTTSATITSKKEWEGGKVPLDRGNTITDNMSKLFPLTP